MLNIYDMQALETEQKTKHQNTVPRLHEVYSGRRDKANRRWHTHTRQLTEGHRARGGETQATGGEGAFLFLALEDGGPQGLLQMTLQWLVGPHPGRVPQEQEAACVAFALAEQLEQKHRGCWQHPQAPLFLCTSRYCTFVCLFVFLTNGKFVATLP